MTKNTKYPYILYFYIFIFLYFYGNIPNVKKLLILSLVAIASFATASVDTFLLQYDATAPTAPNFHCQGHAGDRAGVRADGTRFGTVTYNWDRKNTDSYTHAGYKVETSVELPTAPNVAYYPTEATVTWLDPTEGGSGGAG